MSSKSSKNRKKITKEQRDLAVDEYLAGKKTGVQIAEELGVDVQSVYRWKTARTERAKGVRIDELVAEGNSREIANKILNLELQIEEYKKKTGEQAVIIDLLKKLQTSIPSAPESELAGLIKTTRKSAARKGRVK